MKKLLLASAVAALSVSAANAAPQIYGKAFLSADYVNAEFDGIDDSTPAARYNDDSDSVQINSNSSRIGLRGSEAMTANTDVIYQLEYGVSVDGEDRTFQSRDTYLGLANKDLGQFRFGRNTSVVDYVNNVVVNQGFWDNLGTTKLEDNEKVGALNMVDSARQNNSVIWQAPKYNDLPLDLALMYKADESFVSDSDDRDSGFAASLMFDAGTGITAGLAYDKDVNLTGDLIRGTATVDMSKYMAYPVTLGALYQVADYDGGEEDETGLVLSGEMGLTNFAKPASVYLQYNKTDNLGGLDNIDSDQIVLGGKYMFKDNMIAHAYIGQNSSDGAVYGRGDKDADPSTYVAYTGDADVFALGGGLEYLF